MKKKEEKKSLDEKAQERRRRDADRRNPNDRRREPRVLVETGNTRPDRREGPRRTREDTTSTRKEP